MDFTYIILLIVVLCWTINPFLKKVVSKKMNAEEFMLLNHFIISSIMIIYLIYLVSNGKVSRKCIQNLKDSGICGKLFWAKMVSSKDLFFCFEIKMQKEWNFLNPVKLEI